MPPPVANLNPARFVGIKNALIPTEGPKAVPVLLPFFTSGQSSLTVDLMQSQRQKVISLVQSIFIDNRNNTAQLLMTMPDSQQTIRVAPGAQIYVPVLASAESMKFDFSTTGNIDVQVIFLNIPVPSFAWNEPATSSFPPNTSIFGRTGGITADITNAAAIGTSAAAYASGNLCGGKITLLNATRTGVLTGILQGIVLTNAIVATNIPFDVFLFQSDPTNTTFTNNAAFSVNALDFDKLFAIVNVSGGTNVGPALLYQGTNLTLPFVSATTSIFAAVVARGAITFATSTDLTLRGKVIQD